MINCSSGRRSNNPDTIRRRVCRPVSACQPQPAIDSSIPNSPGRPEKYACCTTCGGGAGCRYTGTFNCTAAAQTGANCALSRNNGPSLDETVPFMDQAGIDL